MSVGNMVMTSADIGPGNAVASVNFDGVRELRYNFPDERLQLILANGKTRDFDYSTIATITHTIAAGVATVTIAK